jgi:hypothetical protein
MTLVIRGRRWWPWLFIGLAIGLLAYGAWSAR